MAASKCLGEVIGTDVFSDLALVQVLEREGVHRLYAVPTLGDSDCLEAGALFFDYI